MILNAVRFLDLLMKDKDIQRISRVVCPKEGNDIFLFRSSGVPERILLSLAEKILVELKGKEHLLRPILGESINIEISQSRVRSFVIDHKESLEDPEATFPLGLNISLYRNKEKVHVTLWK